MRLWGASRCGPNCAPAVKLDNGPETQYGPGDFGFLPAGHDAWSVGDKRCVWLDVTGVAQYAQQT
jgi:hypothetical protein